MYRGGPKIGSGGTELRRWGQSQKPVWLDSQWYGIQRRKPGLAIHHVLTMWGWGGQESYRRDNRLVAGESTHRTRGLVPRCRLFPSGFCSRSQGWGCSPTNRERELGLDRRETGRSLPDRGVVVWGEVAPSTRGTGQRSLWFISCPTGQAEQLSCLG